MQKATLITKEEHLGRISIHKDIVEILRKDLNDESFVRFLTGPLSKVFGGGYKVWVSNADLHILSEEPKSEPVEKSAKEKAIAARLEKLAKELYSVDFIGWLLNGYDDEEVATMSGKRLDEFYKTWIDEIQSEWQDAEFRRQPYF